MHYPDEAGFEETLLEPSDFIDVTDIDAIRDWFREHQEDVATSRTDFWDWALRFMGIQIGTTFLWCGTPFLVVDDRNWGLSLGVKNLASRYHTEQSIEQLDRFFLDWTDGNVVPAMNTGEWVERRDANQKMYGLFATDEQDPNDYYFLYGGPVPVNTAGRSREEILDAVITEVLDQYTIGFDIPEDEVFVVELSDFPK